MAQISISTLFSVATVEAILATGLELASALGLPVTSWRAFDPTRSLYKFVAEKLGAYESTNAEYIRAGFLSAASEEWLTVLAWEVYGVERVEATQATPTVTITNSGGGYYEEDALGVIFRASGIDKTYRNVDAFTIASGETITLDLIADEEGSDSTVAVNEVDELVTTLDGVGVDSSTAAVGTDEQSDDSLKEQCEDTRGALSPNGPADAYDYVVKNATLTGVTDITRSTTVDDSEDLVVTVYVAGASGPVAGASVTAAQAAIAIWATPLTVTATVVNSIAQAIAVTATIEGDDMPADFEDTIEDALAALFATLDIGSDVSLSMISHTIHEAIPEIDRVVLTLPAADVVVPEGYVPTAGAVTITEV